MPRWKFGGGDGRALPHSGLQVQHVACVSVGDASAASLLMRLADRGLQWMGAKNRQAPPF